VARRIDDGIFTARFGLLDLGFAILAVILFIGSRDTMAKYQTRVSQLLDTGRPTHGFKPLSSARRWRRPAQPSSNATHDKGQHDLPPKTSLDN
jgi:hypothetical protein